MLTVKQLRTVLEGMNEDRQILIRQGGWIYAAVYAEEALLTPDDDGGHENEGPRTPNDVDVLMFGVME